MSTQRQPSKSDAPSRPPKPQLPRRLFSFDTSRLADSTASRRTASADYNEPASRRTRPTNPFELSEVPERRGEQENYEDPFNLNVGVREPWSPQASEASSLTPTSPPSATKALSNRLEPVRPFSTDTTTSNGSQYATVPSNRLWDNLRQHVLTPPIRPASPTISTSSHTSTTHTVRTAQLKPSRLAKFGFKHVVEGARVIQDDTRRFGEEILRACSIARHGDVHKSSKDSSTTSLSSNGPSAPTPSGGKRLDYLRRPMSVSSLSSSTGLQSGFGASLRYLYQILVYHAGVVADANATQHLAATLPHESRVLSTLLCPFLTPSRYSINRIEEEQITAVEAFELISKSWIPIDEAAVVERCLWCTKTASSMSPHPTRTRILGSLWRILVPTDKPKHVLSSQGFQSLSSGLILLLVSLYRPASSVGARSPGAVPAQTEHGYHPDVVLLKEVIDHFIAGSLGDLEDESVEDEFGAEQSAKDRKDPTLLRKAVFIDGIANTLENSFGSADVILRNVVDHYWPVPSDSHFSNLQAAITNNRINTFCRFALAHIGPVATTPLQPLTMSPSAIASPGLPTSFSSSTLNMLDELPKTSLVLIASVIRTRIIQEAEALDVHTDLDHQVVQHTRIHVARVLLCMLQLREDAFFRVPGSGQDVFGETPPNNVQTNLKECISWAVDTLSTWYRAGTAMPWKEVLERTLRDVISNGWQTSIPILFALLKRLPDDLRRVVFSSVMPIVNDQLVEDPPAYPSPELSSFLTSASQLLPPVLYKPLFACAYSDQEVVVVNHLCTIQVHSKYVKDYWLRDVEMLCVVLLSDVGIAPSAADGGWASARLGQMVLLVELIGKVQMMRMEREGSMSGSDARFIEVIRFVTALEARLWETIDVRERTRKLLLPSSQRMLLCLLFREFRLFTRSLKLCPWLSPMLEWFEVFCADDHIGTLEQEVVDTVHRIQGLYIAAQEGVQQIHKRHTTMLMTGVFQAAPLEASNDNRLDLAATFVEYRKLIDSLSKGYISRSMKLFVAMSTLMTISDYQRLSPLLWQSCLLDNADLSATASACFLVMQCAEKTPEDILPAIEVDLHASDDMTRLEAIRKVANMVNWRFQITTQNFLTDRAHRPFKLGRPPLPFIATDIGTSLYIHIEDVNQNKDSDQVPLELKRRLADLGWVEEDADAEDPRREIIATPLSVLPPNQIDRMEVGTADIFTNNVSPSSPTPSPRRPRMVRDQTTQFLQPVDEVSALLRRNSSSGGPSSGIKRRPVFVPTLSLIFRHLSNMVYDNNFVVAAAARKTIFDLMRNDPALLTRSILDFLAGEEKDMNLVVTMFTALMHVKKALPPPLTHYMFNNIAGFLKQIAKSLEGPDSLDDFAQVVPSLTNLAIQVSGMSIREVRRSKMEHIFIPSGSLWFQATAPKGPMFPRNAGDTSNPFEPLPARLVPITMIRVSQNLFFLSMLKRNYKDVQAIRKNMSRLVLPSLDDYAHVKNLELKDFVPRRGHQHRSSAPKDATVEVLSLMLARSYILLVTQIFRSMPRHLSDRHELAVLVDGLNRCLLSHDDDINILSQVLIALMVASTRFRRMFLTGAGYTLFMPTLAKIYAEKPTHPGIRSAIEYALGRFYALHRESFLYQCMSIIGQITMLPQIEDDWYSKTVFDMFASLRKGSTNPAADMGGIHNVNRGEEREALILHTADEKPQTFLSSIRRGDSQSNNRMSFELPDEYESARLSMDNLVRLCLTVIAHDLTISRAQHFLRLLRLLAPYLYNASGSSRTVLSDGITALGIIFTKAFARPKGGGELPRPLQDEEDKSFLSTPPGLESLSDEKAKAPSDSKAMRFDFLLLVLAFGQSGGQVSLQTARQAIDVTKSLLKDWGEGSVILSSFLRDFVKMLLRRDEAPTAKGVVAFLREISPIFHAFMAVDFSGPLESVLILMRVPLYNQDPAFSQVIVAEICTAGLAACDLAASENRLTSLPYRPALVALLAEAIFLSGVDIIGEIEKRPPTHQFLANIVLPLTLAMKTNAQITSDSTRTPAQRNALINAWVRLLFYAMAACQKSRRDDDDVRNAFKGITGSFRTKLSNSRKHEGSFWKSHLPTFMVAIQVIKVVITRGAEDIAIQHSLGVWERLGTFFRTMLSEGSAEFALKVEPGSNLATPTPSPRASTHIASSTSAQTLFVSSSGLGQPPSPRDTAYSRRLARPRLVDYTMWSMLEFACAYRSPLRMHLKLLMMEKLIALDKDLDQRGMRRPVSGVGFSPALASASSRRISASIGSKARQRASAFFPSPDSSPYLMPSTPSRTSTALLASGSSNLSLAPPGSLPPSISLTPSLLELPVRKPGYAITPVTPQDRKPGRPKIVHLGPSSPAMPSTSSPLIGGGLRRYSRVSSPSRRVSQADSTLSADKTKETLVRSPNLVKETYRRIRGVQVAMGFADLLPLSGSTVVGENERELAALETWTKAQALAAITQETEDLMEEFEETFTLGEGNVVTETEPSSPVSPIALTD